MLSPKCVVLRDGGSRASLESKELVPGDVIFLQPGDCVPADARLLGALLVFAVCVRSPRWKSRHVFAPLQIAKSFFFHHTHTQENTFFEKFHALIFAKPWVAYFHDHFCATASFPLTPPLASILLLLRILCTALPTRARRVHRPGVPRIHVDRRESAGLKERR